MIPVSRQFDISRCIKVQTTEGKLEDEEEGYGVRSREEEEGGGRMR